MSANSLAYVLLLSGKPATIILISRLCSALKFVWMPRLPAPNSASGGSDRIDDVDKDGMHIEQIGDPQVQMTQGDGCTAVGDIHSVFGGDSPSFSPCSHACPSEYIYKTHVRISVPPSSAGPPKHPRLCHFFLRGLYPIFLFRNRCYTITIHRSLPQPTNQPTPTHTTHHTQLP